VGGSGDGRVCIRTPQRRKVWLCGTPHYRTRTRKRAAGCGLVDLRQRTGRLVGGSKGGVPHPPWPLNECGGMCGGGWFPGRRRVSPATGREGLSMWYSTWTNQPLRRAPAVRVRRGGVWVALDLGEFRGGYLPPLTRGSKGGIPPCLVALWSALGSSGPFYGGRRLLGVGVCACVAIVSLHGAVALWGFKGAKPPASSPCRLRGSGGVSHPRLWGFKGGYSPFCGGVRSEGAKPPELWRGFQRGAYLAPLALSPWEFVALVSTPAKRGGLSPRVSLCL